MAPREESEVLKMLKSHIQKSDTHIKESTEWRKATNLRLDEMQKSLTVCEQDNERYRALEEQAKGALIFGKFLTGTGIVSLFFTYIWYLIKVKA